jgi:hypothetical protein
MVLSKLNTLLDMPFSILSTLLLTSQPVRPLKEL